MPWLDSSRMSAPTLRVSSGPSAAVGSSMIRTRALKWIARAIATAWRWPPDRLATRFDSDGSRSFMRPSVAARRLHRLLVHEAEPAGDLASEEEIGDGVEVLREREVLIDRLDAERLGVARRADRRPARRRIRISPQSAGKTPDRILISVDLAGAVVAEQAENLAGAAGRG